MSFRRWRPGETARIRGIPDAAHRSGNVAVDWAATGAAAPPQIVGLAVVRGTALVSILGARWGRLSGVRRSS
eukprot:940809-Alexandrium_andersonii.AAC.1